jgi:hypothetical protein
VEGGSISCRNSSIGILCRFELDKCVATLHYNFSDGAELTKEILQVSSLNVTGDTTDINLEGFGLVTVIVSPTVGG